MTTHKTIAEWYGNNDDQGEWRRADVPTEDAHVRWRCAVGSDGSTVVLQERRTADGEWALHDGEAATEPNHHETIALVWNTLGPPTGVAEPVLVNLTPHEVTLRTAMGQPVVLSKAAMPVRLETDHEAYGYHAGIPLGTARLQGTGVDLPEPIENVLYITSMAVARVAAAAGRTDVASPGRLLRNAKGAVIGCDGLVRWDEPTFADPR